MVKNEGLDAKPRRVSKPTVNAVAFDPACRNDHLGVQSRLEYPWNEFVVHNPYIGRPVAGGGSRLA